MTKKGYTFKRIQYQLLATCIGNLSVFGQGCQIGWFSPSLPILRAENSPLASGALNDDEIGWIGSLAALGAMSGTLMFGTFINRLGFKLSLMLTVPPLVLSWLLIVFAQNAWYIMASRYLLGISGGGTFLCIPQFVSEIADDFIRGQLNSYLMMIFYAGVLTGYVGGSYLDYSINPWVMLTVPIIFVCLFAFMPETPQFLLRNDRLEDAENSIRYYRNCKRGVADKIEEEVLQAEFEKFQAIARQNSAEPDIRLADFVTPDALKAFCITICLLAVNQWSGSFLMSNYAATIFKESGTEIDANISSIVMGIFQVCGYYTASQLMDRMGRRSLHMVSTAGSSLSLLVTGVYVYLMRNGVDMSEYSLVPVVSLSFFIFICAIGIIPVPFIMMTEIMPSKIRKIGVTICTCISFSLQFFIFKLFPFLLSALELHGCMFLFAGVTTFGLMFGVFVVKETKGKNLDVLRPEAPKNVNAA